MRKLAILFLAATGFGLAAARAVDLKESKFTQVVNDVQVVSTADNSKHPAAVDAIFKLPDVVRTGAASRAELVADDRTITRIGANTIFSFDQASRTIRLDQGSLLFNSPKGKGGGSIHTTAATAAVLGTTIIVTTTPDGGFKVLVLEGKAEVKFLSGANRNLKAGQMVFVLPGSLPGPVVVFRLDQQVAGSQLVNGFASVLPTLPLINQEVTRQIKLISSGRAADTGLLVGSVATPTSVQTVQIFNELNASPGASNGVAPGLNGSANGTPTGGGGNIPPGGTYTLPAGFVVPPGLTFDSLTGGFLTTDGLLFIANPGGGGTNLLAGPPIESAAVPALASLSDSTIGTLDPAHEFSIPFLAVDTSGMSFNTFYAPGAGYIARNITFSGSMIDLTPFKNQLAFDFAATQTMSFGGSTVSITGSPALLGFDAVNFSFSSGSSLTVDSPTLTFTSPFSLSLVNAHLNDPGNTIFLDQATSVNLNNTIVSAGTVSLFAGSTVSLTGTTASTGGLNATQGVSVFSGSGMTNGVDIYAQAGNTGTTITPATINLQNSAGMLTANNGAHFTTDAMTVNSPGGILFDTTTVTASQSATFAAGNAPGNTITIQNTTFDGLGSVIISANTIVLNGVNFNEGGTTTLTPANPVLAPNPNTGAAVVPGEANYGTGVTWGPQHLPAQNFTGGPGSGKPIIIN